MMYFDPTGETPIRELVKQNKGSITWNSKTKLANVTLNDIECSFKVNSDRTIDLVKDDVIYGTFVTSEAELIQYVDSKGSLVAYIDIKNDVFNKYFNEPTDIAPKPEPGPNPRKSHNYTVNSIVKSSDSNLSSAAIERILYLNHMYGNLINNDVPKTEADLIRKLDKIVIGHSWRNTPKINGFSIKDFYIKDINYAMREITNLESEITKQSNLEGIPKALISSALFREIMFLGLDDIVDGTGMKIGDRKVGQTIGISQISVLGVRNNEMRVADKEKREQRFTGVSDEEIVKMLIDPATSVYFVAIALKDRAYDEGISINSRNPNDIQRIFARYNDSNGIKGWTIGPIKTKEVYGKETYEYYKEFEKYHKVVDENRVIK